MDHNEETPIKTELDAYGSNVWVLCGVKRKVTFHMDHLVEEIKRLIPKCGYKSELRYLSTRLWLDSIFYPSYTALMEQLSHEISATLIAGKFNHLPEKPEGLLGL